MTRTLPASDYRKRPVTVKVAGPLRKENCVEIARWCGGWTHIANTLVIPTLEGDMHASYGDWIIQGVAGEFYPCKPDIFAQTYEPVTANETTPSDAAIGQAFREFLSDADTRWEDACGAIEDRAREIEQSRGALPELPTPLGPWQSTSDSSGYYTYTVDQMLDYGEACRRMGNRDE